MLARRDSVRSKMGIQRRSSDDPPGNLLAIPQEARRSGRQRVELGKGSVSWAWGSVL